MHRDLLVENLDAYTARDRITAADDVSAENGVVEEMALEVAQRHAVVQQGFADIISVTGYVFSDGERLTPRLLLGEAHDKLLGTGVLTAELRALPDCSTVTTIVWFESVGQKAVSLTAEHYRQRIFGDGYADQARQIATGSSHYDSVADVLTGDLKKDLPEIGLALETQAMLREALLSPQLNPDFAEKAAAAWIGSQPAVH